MKVKKKGAGRLEATLRLCVVKTRGRWFRVDAPPETWRDIVERALGRWDKEDNVILVPAGPFSACSLYDIFGERLRGDEAFNAFLAQGRMIEEAANCKSSTDLPQPMIRRTDGWRHQLQAYHFARLRGSCLLAMGMGTGKTKVAIDLAQNAAARRVLVISPLSVVSVWPRELERHAALPYRIAALDRGSVARKAECLADALNGTKGTVWAVVNYESAWRPPLSSILLGEKWDYVFLDESHRIKAPKGRISDFCYMLSKQAKHRICLSGTPTPHDILDAWSQFRFIDPSIFGTSYYLFRARYAVLGGFNGKNVVGFQREEEFSRKFHSSTYRVSEDVLDLPEAVHQMRYASLDPQTRKVYRQIEREFYAQVESGEITVSNALTKVVRLQQIASGFVKTDDGRMVRVGDEKGRLLADVLEDLPVNEPLVIFARFHGDLDLIRDTCQKTGRRYCELSGRANGLADWQNGRYDVIGVQIQSGGEGVDLTRARYCIYYSLSYERGKYEQSLRRVHRPGQTRPVCYVHLICQDTVDERVYQAIEERRDIVEAILGGGGK